MPIDHAPAMRADLEAARPHLTDAEYQTKHDELDHLIRTRATLDNTPAEKAAKAALAALGLVALIGIPVGVLNGHGNLAVGWILGIGVASLCWWGSWLVGRS